jgi:aryl-phospho-beta-D-glucosidase BglC (GH1 family)
MRCSLAITLACLLAACPLVRAADCPADAFTLWNTGALRGANIFQGRNPGGATNGFGDGDFTQADIDDLARAGANYVQISHAGTFAEQPPYALDLAAEANLDRMIDMVSAAGLYAVIAFRSGPGRNENAISNRDAAPLDEIWRSQAAHDAWVAMLRHTAERYGSNPAVVGYSIMVEPNAYALFGFVDPPEFYLTHARELEDVNRLHVDATAAIRQVDPETPILLEPDGYGNLNWVPFLFVPTDARTVYTTHDYTPFDYTHEVVNGATYPGMYDIDGDNQKERVDQAFLATHLGALQTVSDERGVPVAITEFGVHRTAPNAATYMSDRIGIQNTLGSWAVWTWQPAGFIDPFNMHEASPVLDALKAGWAGNCVRPGGGPARDGTIMGRAFRLTKKGTIGMPLLKIKITVDQLTTTTRQKPKKGSYALTVTAGTHQVSAFAGKKQVCRVGATDGPETAAVAVNGLVRVDVYCGKRAVTAP